jgi:hypothetical protein
MSLSRISRKAAPRFHVCGKCLFALIFFVVASVPQVRAQNGTSGDHWVATWATAQQLIRATPPPRPAGAPPAAAPAGLQRRALVPERLVARSLCPISRIKLCA